MLYYHEPREEQLGADQSENPPLEDPSALPLGRFRRLGTWGPPTAVPPFFPSESEALSVKVDQRQKGRFQGR